VNDKNETFARFSMCPAETKTNQHLKIEGKLEKQDKPAKY
jgi:hypothetical protein